MKKYLLWLVFTGCASASRLWNGDVAFNGSYNYADGTIPYVNYDWQFTFLDPNNMGIPTWIPNSAGTYCHPSGGIGCAGMMLTPDTHGDLTVDFYTYNSYTDLTDLRDTRWTFTGLNLNAGTILIQAKQSFANGDFAVLDMKDDPIATPEPGSVKFLAMAGIVFGFAGMARFGSWFKAGMAKQW